MSMLVKPDIRPPGERPRRPGEGGCAKKKLHPSRKGATDQLKRLQRDPSAAAGLSIYWCEHHGGYHVGHHR